MAVVFSLIVFVDHIGQVQAQHYTVFCAKVKIALFSACLIRKSVVLTGYLEMRF